ncbi:hypothetical protein [Spiroplasma eriocheiris]|uniref:Uncharacterized protein n=1 Tax=Spiroplasma eriocheiris TaxID=315358 RepID=A0A0H3XKM3_9MOLU|nr:hypothetical protein [Spiroplasma eriocheiris]AHF57522.1 hypothetical protein SPE_0393 [Spiroplasma eriocheiris CCTCC M 207170]AKM53979.1 hypothetical protein SERIO_v1c04000 [Spiroplasma eriocheiris]
MFDLERIKNFKFFEEFKDYIFDYVDNVSQQLSKEEVLAIIDKMFPQTSDLKIIEFLNEVQSRGGEWIQYDDHQIITDDNFIASSSNKDLVDDDDDEGMSTAEVDAAIQDIINNPTVEVEKNPSMGIDLELTEDNFAEDSGNDDSAPLTTSDDELVDEQDDLSRAVTEDNKPISNSKTSPDKTTKGSTPIVDEENLSDDDSINQKTKKISKKAKKGTKNKQSPTSDETSDTTNNISSRYKLEPYWDIFFLEISHNEFAGPSTPAILQQAKTSLKTYSSLSDILDDYVAKHNNGEDTTELFAQFNENSPANNVLQQRLHEIDKVLPQNSDQLPDEFPTGDNLNLDFIEEKTNEFEEFMIYRKFDDKFLEKCYLSAFDNDQHKKIIKKIWKKGNYSNLFISDYTLMYEFIKQTNAPDALVKELWETKIIPYIYIQYLIEIVEMDISDIEITETIAKKLVVYFELLIQKLIWQILWNLILKTTVVGKKNIRKVFLIVYKLTKLMWQKKGIYRSYS